ncbi:MAG TPA: rhodanese-like domain-containing protein [Methylomirabilota bacterium]|nr:rhodanese-like domain-containing protein [Methylomirabilota bacterium]
MPDAALQPGPLTPQSPVADALARYPGAQRALFRKYHIGGCSSCAFDPNETIANLCARNGNLNAEEMLTYLEQSHREDEKLLIEPSALAELRKRSSEIRLVDIRTREEHDAVRLPDAHFFTEQLHQEILGRWPKSSPVIFYDHTGKRALDAAAYFHGHGFTEARALRGGIDAWSREVDSSVPRYKLD